ncbi:unnamed protein product, partial [Amoebophrya sp. A120]
RRGGEEWSRCAPFGGALSRFRLRGLLLRRGRCSNALSRFGTLTQTRDMITREALRACPNCSANLGTSPVPCTLACTTMVTKPPQAIYGPGRCVSCRCCLCLRRARASHWEGAGPGAPSLSGRRGWGWYGPRLGDPFAAAVLPRERASAVGQDEGDKWTQLSHWAARWETEKAGAPPHPGPPPARVVGWPTRW